MAYLASGLFFLLIAAIFAITTVVWVEDCVDDCQGGAIGVAIVGVLGLIGLTLAAAGVVRMTQDRQRRRVAARDRDLQAIRRQH